MNTRQAFKDFIGTSKDEASACILLVQDSASRISYKMRITDLMHQMMSEYVQSSTLKSMAFENREDYALASHDHDIYTNVAYSTKSYENPLKVVHLSDETNYIDCSISVSQHNSSSLSDIILPILSAAQPKIGTIEFKLSTEQYPLTNDVNFIGWVPLDGSSYQLADFNDQNGIKNTFQHTTTTFTVPNVTNYMKFNLQLNSMCTYHQCYNVVAPHGHDVDSSKTPTMTLNIDDFNLTATGNKVLKLPSRSRCRDWGNEGIHHGRGSSEQHTTEFTNELNRNTFVNADVRTLADGESNAIFEPSHNMFQAFVYVGRTKYSAPLYRDDNVT